MLVAAEGAVLYNSSMPERRQPAPGPTEEKGPPMIKEAEYHEHVRTYRGFVKVSTYCAIGVAVILGLMAIFLV